MTRYRSSNISASLLTMMVAFSGNRLTVTSLYGRRDPMEDDMDMMLTLVMIAELCTEA